MELQTQQTVLHVIVEERPNPHRIGSHIKNKSWRNCLSHSKSYPSTRRIMQWISLTLAHALVIRHPFVAQHTRQVPLYAHISCLQICHWRQAAWHVKHQDSVGVQTSDTYRFTKKSRASFHWRRTLATFLVSSNGSAISERSATGDQLIS